MPSPETMTITLAEATDRQILIHLFTRMETHMSQINEAVTHLLTSAAKEVTDIRTSMQAQIDVLVANNANLSAEATAAVEQLRTQSEQMAAATQRIQDAAAQYDANDVQQPTAPVEPTAPVTPDQPTPVDPTPGVDAGTVPTVTDPTTTVTDPAVTPDQPVTTDPTTIVTPDQPGADPTVPPADQNTTA